MQISPARLFLFLVALLGVAVNEVNCLEFNFSEFKQEDGADQLSLQGSNIAFTAIQVTPVSRNAPIFNLSGRTLYHKPFRLHSKSKGVIASFNTTFVLNILNQTTPGGEGLAFIVTGNRTLPDNSYGQWLGIANSQSNGTFQASIVAVEFDTRKSYPDDLDSNHVGLDINSIYSVKQVSLSTYGLNLSTGVDLKVRIIYDAKNLSVFVGNNTENLVFSEPIDLSEYLPETVHLGFSASTGIFTERNCVKSWNFTGTVVKDSPKQFWIWIVISVSLVVITAAVIYVCYIRMSEKEKEKDAYPSIEAAIQGCSTAPIKFHLKELKKATNKFNPKNKLGKGTVYKGNLRNRDVAVKRISKKSTQGEQEFIAEVTTIGNLHHRNLVKLIGWCYESKDYLLVYEFLPNGSLDRFIFHDSKLGHQEPLSWVTRLNIISGVAQALDYLHNGIEKTVLHHDIKASNVMLDSGFNPKLGDFGLARTINHSEQTHHSTKELAGTPRYMAPECILTGRATVETDVYALGVLLLEVACGKKPGSQSEQNGYSSFIVNWLWELYKVGRILDGADPMLKGDFEREDMRCVIVLGLACCHANPNKRPSMKTVLQVLSGEAPPPVVPTERPVFMWPPLPPSFKYIDLSEYLPETVHVGFSNSTGIFTELNCVRSWNFTGTLIKDSPKRVWIYIAASVSHVLKISGVIYLRCTRGSGMKEEEDAFANIEAAIQGCSTAPMKFHSKELKKATNKFNPKNKLGKGGFGTVYKGTLRNKDVAVKRVSKKSTQGKQEFIAEVTTIGNLYHRNLVKLIGWCYESKDYLLVYEFLPNGSLDRFIFHDRKSGYQEPLSWLSRLNIISGVAQAVDYLHNGCEKTVLHRDIKACSIMLDSEFNPKLGDFGLACTIKHSEQTHHSTKELAGTPGYIAPEYILTGRATIETDIYAFGVLLLEVACGRKAGSQSEQNDYRSFIVNWLWELYKVGRILDGVDPRLKGDFETEDMRCVLVLGLACCHPNPNKRPSMKTVLQVLRGEAQPPVVSTERPAFVWPILPSSFEYSDDSVIEFGLTPIREIIGDLNQLDQPPESGR